MSINMNRKLTQEERMRAANILIAMKRLAMAGIPIPRLKKEDREICELLLREKKQIDCKFEEKNGTMD